MRRFQEKERLYYELEHMRQKENIYEKRLEEKTQIATVFLDLLLMFFSAYFANIFVSVMQKNATSESKRGIWIGTVCFAVCILIRIFIKRILSFFYRQRVIHDSEDEKTLTERLYRVELSKVMALYDEIFDFVTNEGSSVQAECILVQAIYETEESLDFLRNCLNHRTVRVCNETSHLHDEKYIDQYSLEVYFEILEGLISNMEKIGKKLRKDINGYRLLLEDIDNLKKEVRNLKKKFRNAHDI